MSIPGAWRSIPDALRSTRFDLTNLTFPDNLPGELRWREWDPDIIPSGSMTISNVDMLQSEYMVMGSMVYFHFDFFFTVGGTPSTTVWVTTPVAPAVISGIAGRSYNRYPVVTEDATVDSHNDIVVPRAGATAASAPDVDCFRVDFDFSGGSWSAGNNRRITGTGFYKRDY